MWHVLKVRSGSEEKVKEVLSRHFEVEWIALKKLEIRTPSGRRYRISLTKDKEINVGGAKIVIRDGKAEVRGGKVKVRMVEADAPFRGYLFVKGNPYEIQKVSENLKDVVGLLVTGSGVASISDDQLKELKEKVLKGERIRKLLPEKGMRIKVTSGQWAGAEGVITQVHEDLSVTAELQFYDRSVTAELPLHSLILLT